MTEEHEDAIGLTVRVTNLELGEVCSPLLVATYQAALWYRLSKVNLAELEI